MLSLFVDSIEFYDSDKNEFIYTKPQTIVMEHSLVAISKWESKFHKPFWNASGDSMTHEELIYYFMCMTITQNVDPILYNRFGKKQYEEIVNYMQDPMTATWFSGQNTSDGHKVPVRRKTITSEVVYAIMVEYGIPFECQKWHVNRLFTLIKVLQEREKPASKYSPKETMAKYSSLNKQRRALMNSKG